MTNIYLPNWIVSRMLLIAHPFWFQFASVLNKQKRTRVRDWFLGLNSSGDENHKQKEIFSVKNTRDKKKHTRPTRTHSCSHWTICVTHFITITLKRWLSSMDALHASFSFTALSLTHSLVPFFLSLLLPLHSTGELILIHTQKILNVRSWFCCCLMRQRNRCTVEL